MGQPRIPEKLEDINAEWFSQILGKSVKPEPFKLTANVGEGLGLVSTLVRVELTTGDGTEHSVLMKLMPTDEAWRAVFIEDKVDKVEILSYKILLPQLITEVPELGKYICDFTYAEIQEADHSKNIPYNSALVLKDLKPEGYYVIHVTTDIPDIHFQQGLNFLVQFHGASVFLEKKLGKSIPAAFGDQIPFAYGPISSGDDAEFPTLYSLFPSAFPSINQLIEKSPRLKSEARPFMDKIEKNTKGIFRAVINAGQDHATLVHGDLWPHNIMVKDGAPIKVIDWQIVGYIDPAYDLALFLVSCLPLDTLNPNGVMQAAKAYHDETVKLFQSRGFEVTRSWEDFSKFFSTWGLAIAFILMTMCEPLQKEPAGYAKFCKLFELMLDMKVFEFMLTLE